jgi:hypothetical protein
MYSLVLDVYVPLWEGKIIDKLELSICGVACDKPLLTNPHLIHFLDESDSLLTRSECYFYECRYIDNSCYNWCYKTSLDNVLRNLDSDIRENRIYLRLYLNCENEYMFSIISNVDMLVMTNWYHYETHISNIIKINN